ncbi:tripartite motif-containing 3-like isoform X1 [Brachionus plicatilis]|uniref:Tripartite motif-containing 3-like isoform X1 n=1 Tax=Brachionus plicatilis TaxID=10195 RepID=A0A3M7PV93_BRAPC|nr:tripartite motif-containing 3-like isoform X1 [Brachionus plicatilis]
MPIDNLESTGNDQSDINTFKEQYNQFLQNLIEKKNELSSHQETLTNTYQAKKATLLTQIDSSTQKKVSQLDFLFSKIFEKLESGVHEINLRKQELEAQFQQFEHFELLLEVAKNKNDNEFNEDDALMINDYVEAELIESSINLSENEKRMKMKENATTIEQLINENLMADNLLDEILNGTLEINELNIENVEISVEDLVAPNQALCSLDLVDSTQFKMETELCENFSFRKNAKCYITFSFPENTELRNAENSKNLHKYLKIEIFDSHKNPVSFELKEKVNPGIHFIRVYFIPQSIGIFQLHIHYKNNPIPHSPFHFVVMTEALQQPSLSVPDATLSSSSTSATNFSSDGYQVHNDSSINLTLFGPPVKRSEAINAQKPPSLPSLNAGRGRLLKMNTSNHGTGSLFWNKSVTENPLSLCSPYKRKSPEINTDSNNNQFVNEEQMDTEDSNGSSKLPKLVMAQKTLNSNQLKSNDYPSMYPKINILSSYLRRFLNGPNRWHLDQIPPLKAQFQRKFTNLNYPIGLRSCSMRNWLIVCDNGSNSVKIFEKSTGELIRQIEEDHLVKLRRPSAVLLCERKSEMYVKDDKEIFVFDLEQNCKMVRKFGSGILRKPYGLAYDDQENVVCVDADIRNPLVHVFDKQSGFLISSKAYHPTMKLFANSHVLNQRFGQSGILAQRMQAFDKTKVRFICSNKNSVYSSDLGRSIVYKTNLDGHIEMAFGFHGKQRGELFEPSGIFVDEDGQAILVGDSKNDRLQIYDQNGIYRCDIMFLGEKIVRPSDIYIDHEGYLYVSCFIQHCVKKYKLTTD